MRRVRSNQIQKLILTSSSFEIYSCNFLFVEIFKHKAKIEKVSGMDEKQILEQMELIMQYINFKNENLVPASFYIKAYELCKDVDVKDVPFVALSLFFKL